MNCVVDFVKMGGEYGAGWLGVFLMFFLFGVPILLGLPNGFIKPTRKRLRNFLLVFILYTAVANVFVGVSPFRAMNRLVINGGLVEIETPFRIHGYALDQVEGVTPQMTASNRHNYLLRLKLKDGVTYIGGPVSLANYNTVYSQCFSWVKNAK